jgi:predicted nuclease of predicted toxin-antitoxin system
MTIRFYFDEHMPRTVAAGIIQRGYDVVMAVDVGMEGKGDDTEHLAYAHENELVIVTFDRPFAGRTASRTNHKGLICFSENLRADVGGMIRLLVQFAEEHSPEDTFGQVFWLKP